MRAAQDPKKLPDPDANQHAHDVCGNCAAHVQGNFCAFCGQSTHVHHSLLHLLEEMVHGLWHFDAKGWRTIPLLIAYPGQLTRRYIDGQRVRFISPLGLFLFMVFFMFFVFSFSKTDTVHLDNKSITVAAKQESQDGIAKGLAVARTKVTTAQAALEQAKASGTEIAAREKELETAQSDAEDLEASLQLLNGQTGDDDKAAPQEPEIVTKLNGTDSEKLKKTILHALKNKELVAYKMKNNAYKFALILVPVSLPILWLMFFWRKNVTLFDHAVFSLYSLSFMAFFAALLSILFEFDQSAIGGILLFIVPPLHMYRQLKGTYQLSGMQTVWRTMLLVLSALLMVVLFIVFVGALSLG